MLNREKVKKTIIAFVVSSLVCTFITMLFITTTEIDSGMPLKLFISIWMFTALGPLNYFLLWPFHDLLSIAMVLVFIIAPVLLYYYGYLKKIKLSLLYLSCFLWNGFGTFSIILLSSGV